MLRRFQKNAPGKGIVSIKAGRLELQLIVNSQVFSRAFTIFFGVNSNVEK
jgi:hypothetical protein